MTSRQSENNSVQTSAFPLQAADATKGAASKADSKTPNPGDLADKAKKSLPFGHMQVGELALDLQLPGSSVKKTDLPDGPKNLFSGGAKADLPSASDLPDLPSGPGNADKVHKCTQTVCASHLLGQCLLWPLMLQQQPDNGSFWIADNVPTLQRHCMQQCMHDDSSPFERDDICSVFKPQEHAT